MKYTEFIPEFYFDSSNEEWIDINERKENYIDIGSMWKDNVKSIYQMLPDLIVVIFNEKDSWDEHIIGLYQGILK